MAVSAAEMGSIGRRLNLGNKDEFSVATLSLRCVRGAGGCKWTAVCKPYCGQISNLALRNWDMKIALLNRSFS